MYNFAMTFFYTPAGRFSFSHDAGNDGPWAGYMVVAPASHKRFQLE